MSTATESKTKFPAAKVRATLQTALGDIASESSALRPEWEPLLDSMRVVGTVLSLEELFPFKLPPDRIVAKGGYGSVDEAVNDMLERLKKLWVKNVAEETTQ